MLNELKEYAKAHNVPIVRDEGLLVLLNEVKKNNYKSVLEIGSAIGYSAINFALLGCTVTTIERDRKMYDIAKDNIHKFSLDEKIELVFSDALDYTPNKKYDLIFIDAAKAQNIKFFLRFSPFLNDNGVIIVDNLDFHGLTDKDPKELSKNLRSLIRKINEFKEFLKDNKEFDTTFIHDGDGMSISRKK